MVFMSCVGSERVMRVCIYLGCGWDKQSSTAETKWIHVDVRPSVNPDVVWDMEMFPYPFESESADEVWLKNSLEHVSFHKVEGVIKEVRRILRRGGRLFIMCPDMEALAYKVILNPFRRWDFKYISYWVYGAQDYPENVHKSGFTKEALRALLEGHGFRIVSMRNDKGTNIICYAEKI